MSTIFKPFESVESKYTETTPNTFTFNTTGVEELYVIAKADLSSATPTINVYGSDDNITGEIFKLGSTINVADGNSVTKISSIPPSFDLITIVGGDFGGITTDTIEFKICTNRYD